jgi:hypothetical protein
MGAGTQPFWGNQGGGGCVSYIFIFKNIACMCRYLGVDSSKDITLTSKWEAKYNSVAQKNMCEFQTMDLRKERLPDGFDLLMMVDMLENLPFADVLDVLYNIQYSSAAVRRCPHSLPYSMPISPPLQSPRLFHGLLLALLIALLIAPDCLTHSMLSALLIAVRSLPCLPPCLIGRKHCQGGRRTPRGCCDDKCVSIVRNM